MERLSKNSLYLSECEAEAEFNCHYIPLSEQKSMAKFIQAIEKQ